jgi:hypothetical protein
MTKLTITRARKILGTLANNVSDEALEQEIKVAEMLKNLFFSSYTRHQANAGAKTINQNGKT